MKTRLLQRLCASVMLAYLPLCAAQATRDCLISGQEFAACAAASEAITSNGNKLTAPSQSYEAGAFEGFVSGVAFAEFRTTWCPKLQFSERQLAVVTSKFVREHSEQWDLEPVALVRLALSGAFLALANGRRRGEAYRLSEECRQPDHTAAASHQRPETGLGEVGCGVSARIEARTTEVE